MHALGRDLKDITLFNNLRILPYNCFHDLKVLHRDKWLYSICDRPTQHSTLSQVYDAIEDFAAFANTYYIGDTMWPWRVLRILEPRHHLCLSWLPQRECIERNNLKSFTYQGDGRLDLYLIKGVERVWWCNLTRDV